MAAPPVYTVRVEVNPVQTIALVRLTTVLGSKCGVLTLMWSPIMQRLPIHLPPNDTVPYELQGYVSAHCES